MALGRDMTNANETSAAFFLGIALLPVAATFIAAYVSRWF